MDNVAGRITTDEGATFIPWTDGYAVGFRVTAWEKPDRYIYLNPSGATDTGDIDDSDVFVYLDAEPDFHNSVCFVNIWDVSA